ncbi:hypothetical protein LEP1GSC037_3319 [Leptospira interrogans str. 2006001854]|uniref:Uncharacterized protein n=2 Tax=Leptospira interrogans TaxID=173 RepID=A0A0E2D4C8_LEPIR|nr:hypothetical protein LEP1GSC105_3822 [Leptospira interrogans str. UI 12758]EMM79219.1 hypothetical protein LEP1GSC037_3319 [Leptospira interrogans str. 2006001854]EMN55303.1 hypothetical protein LEP1GSC089_3818 [Leptospira interrogans serovar Autumnalis str. LP101]
MLNNVHSFKNFRVKRKMKHNSRELLQKLNYKKVFQKPYTHNMT